MSRCDLVLASRDWRFEPALDHGEPVDVYYRLTVNYRPKATGR